MKTQIYINVKDLIMECVRKIWIIIIAMIVFGVLLAGYKYTKEKKSVQNQATTKQETVDVDKMTKDMSKDDLDAAMSYVNLYNYKNQQEDYAADSKIMEINPYKVDTVALQYYVGAADETKAKDMASAYLAYITGGALAEDVVENKELTESARSIQELIQCDATGMTTGVSYYTENTNVINVFVYGTDEQESKNLADGVKTCLDEYSSKLAKVSEHTFTLFEEKYSVTTATKLISLKNDRFGNLASYNTKVTDYESYITDSQLSSAKQIISAQENNEANENDSEDNPAQSTPKVRISKKYLVVGAFLGLVLAAICIILRYIFDPSIKNSKDLQAFYGATYIGDVTDAAAIKLVSSKIISLCENKSSKKVILAGEISEKDNSKITEVVKNIEDKGIKVVKTGNILSDADGIEKLEKDDKLVLLETIRKNKYEEYAQQEALCETLGVDCMGYIALAK